MNETRKLDTIVLNIILFLYPIEQFSIVHIDKVLGAFSPFRMLILPLCLLYIMFRGSTGIKDKNPYMAGAYLFFIAAFVFVSVNGTFTSSFSFLGNIIQFAMAYLLIRNTGFPRSSLYIITTWCVIQIPSIVTAYVYNSLGMSQRYTGFFFDPNYLCAFVNAAVIAAAYLFSTEKRKLLKIYNILVMTFGLLMVFLSYSRGGLLGIMLPAIVFLFAYNKKLLVTISIISIPIISALMIRAQFLTWQDGADNYIDGFLYRTFTLSRDMSELTAERSDFAKEFFEHIDEYLFTGTDISAYLGTYNEGHFVHNGFLEVLIQGGLIIGGIYLLSFLLSLVKEIITANKYRGIPIELLVCLAILICLTSLSYTSKMAWFCMGLIFSLASKKVFYKRMISLERK